MKKKYAEQLSRRIYFSTEGPLKYTKLSLSERKYKIQIQGPPELYFKIKKAEAKKLFA